MFVNEDIKVINGMYGYISTVNNKVRVFLSYEDVLNRLGLIKHNHSNQMAVVTINGKNQYSNDYKPAVDPSKAGIIYGAITQLVNSDFTITNYLPPNPLSPDGYIPVELAIELSRQCGNQQFEMELIHQIIPYFQKPIPGNQYLDTTELEAKRSLIQQNMFAGSASSDDHAFRLYCMYKDTIRYIKDMGKVVLYETDPKFPNGGKWSIVTDRGLSPMLSNLTAFLEKRAKTDEDQVIVRSLQKSHRHKLDIIQSLDSIKEAFVMSTDFDRYPYLLNVLNGVIDLRTGKLLSASPNFYLTQQAPVVYRPKTRSPIFEQFITSVLPDPDTREAVLRYLGYCLTGDTSAQKALFIIGSGANGKSTLLNVLYRLLGTDYAVSAPIKLFSENSIHYKSGATPERDKLIGKRFAQVDEIKAGEVLDAGEFKLLTGSDAIPSRGLYQDLIVFSPTHKFIFSGNFLPELKNNNDGGLNRRLMIAEFPRKFSPDEIDPHLLDDLTDPDSLSGILNILVSEAILYYKYGLHTSQAMRIMKEDYISGLTKIVQSVLEQNYVYDEKSYALHSDLEEEVNNTLPLNTKLNQYQLGRAMRKLGYEPTRINSRGEDRNKIAYFNLKHK